MARINRKAFTLVEMLVVIVIISMLVALLVPAVIAARENARRASCLNRMSQLGKGIQQYEVSKGHLPGYVNQIGKAKFAGSVASSNNMSWVVVILENIGRADLWKEWRNGAGTREVVFLPETICPSDLDKRNKAGALSYVVNCGVSDVDAGSYVPLFADAYKTAACGLFYDHDMTVPNGLPGGATSKVTIGLDGIKDGASQTLMLSENLNAGPWDSSPIVDDSGLPVTQRGVGFLWWSGASALPWASSVPTDVEINSTTASGKFQARPSSNHPGGVNVVYADGHADFISDRIEYATFRDQMVSDRTTVKDAGLLIPAE